MSTFYEYQLLQAENKKLKKKLKKFEQRYCGCGEPLFSVVDGGDFEELASVVAVVGCDGVGVGVGGAQGPAANMEEIVNTLNTNPSSNTLGVFSIDPEDITQIKLIPASYLSQNCEGTLVLQILIGGI